MYTPLIIVVVDEVGKGAAKAPSLLEKSTFIYLPLVPVVFEPVLRLI